MEQQAVLDSQEVKDGELPENFHQRLLDMEIKVQAISPEQDIENINKIELMGLYSAAIEHYHRQADDDRLNYYKEKNSRLNDAIRQTFERNERKEAKRKSQLPHKIQENFDPLTAMNQA